MASMTIATVILISLALGCKPISNQEKNIYTTTDTTADTATNTTSSNTTPGATMPTTTTTTTPSCDQQTWYADADRDGYGGTAYTTTACDQPSGYVDNNDDCNDTNGDINPDAEEICDYIDNDCNGRIDEGQTSNGEAWYDDKDRDGYGGNLTQDFLGLYCSEPDWTESVFGPVANNNRDCNDLDPEINPNTSEICDEIDNDCDGFIDDEDSNVNATTGKEWHYDNDGDGYGTDFWSIWLCGNPENGYIEDGTDCDDFNPEINPGADEICNDIDDDCDNEVDHGLCQ